MPAWSVEEVQRIVLTTVNYSPVVLVALLVSWSFLAYDFSLCGGLLKDDHVLRAIIYFLLFQPIAFFMTWSYIKAVRTLPGYTSDNIGQFDETAEDLETGQTIGLSQSVEGEVGMQPLLQRVFQPSSVTVKRDGRSRFCQKCNLPKHDRSHHCRTCKKCVLKMDHHCPWLNNCIGFYNQKSFYLFLVYSSLYCIVIFSTALPETIRVWNSPMGILALDLNWPFLVLFSGLFGMFLIPFTIFHTNQLVTNRTTIESYERSNYSMGSRRNRDVLTSRFFNAWNLGVKENIVQVLGHDKLRWFIPVGTPQGDGRSFPINSYAYDTLVEEEEEV